MFNFSAKLFIASLYLEGAPLSIERINSILQYGNEDELVVQLDNYIEAFNELELGVRIRRLDRAYQIVASDELTERLADFFSEKQYAVLSQAAIETLAIIAYNSNITRAEISDIRGVESGYNVKNLLDAGLVRISGRKDVPGKPLTYSITDKFYDFFGIKDMKELPTIREWEELNKPK